MVNLWPGVPANRLCDKHLNAVLAEYNNLLVPSMRKGNSIKGYILHGCVDLRTTVARVEECLEEAKVRGHDWKYTAPSEEDKKLIKGYIGWHWHSNVKPCGSEEEMAEMNKRILTFRCQECREKIMKAEA